MNFDEFRQPGMSWRIAPFWSWNDQLDRTELRRQIAEMHRQGYGGFFMHARAGLMTGYLSDDWMECILECAQYAKQLGMQAWLYDEDGWPSGYASGRVPAENPEYREHRLVLHKKESPILQCPENTVLLETSYNGQSYTFVQERTAMGNSRFNGACYIDTMNPDAVAAFLHSTHEKYAQLFGGELKDLIQGIFTDEPCYTMACYHRLPSLPWSPKLPEFFLKLHGYDIILHLDSLFFPVNNYKKIRYDFYTAVSQLFLNSYTRQIAAWCEQYGLTMTGHMMAEDSLLDQTVWIGSAMPHYMYFQMPGIDKLMRDKTQLLTLKQVSSVTEQLPDRNGAYKRVLSECFAGIGHDKSFKLRKSIVDWQAVHGITFINPHLYQYSIRGERKRDYPPTLSHHQPWWEQEKLFADYAARLNYISAQGKREVHCLVLHPIESIWSLYTPVNPEHIARELNERYQRPLNALMSGLVANHVDFHLGDATILEQHASVSGNKFLVGSQAYQAVILPPMNTISAPIYNMLKHFSRQGGDIYALGETPSCLDGCDGCPDWTFAMFISINEALKKLKRQYSSIQITEMYNDRFVPEIQVRVSNLTDGKLYFFSNTDEQTAHHCHIKFIGINQFTHCYLISLTDGRIYFLNEKWAETVIFEPMGSLTVWFTNADADALPMQGFCPDGVRFVQDFSSQTEDVIPNNIHVMHDNVLPLTQGDVQIDGENVPLRYIPHIQHRYFYNAIDGTPFTAAFSFEVCGSIENAYAVIELGENLDSVELNDHKLGPLRCKDSPKQYDDASWLDATYTRFPINHAVVQGKNRLTLYGKKYNNINGIGTHISVEDSNRYFPTELEVPYIIGSFCVEDRKNGLPRIIPFRSPISDDITQEGFGYYSGALQISYDVEIASSGRYLISFNNLSADVLMVQLDGKKAGLGWSPYTLETTFHQGINHVKVIARNNLFNLLGPRNIPDATRRLWIEPWIFSSLELHSETALTIPFGVGTMQITRI